MKPDTGENINERRVVFNCGCEVPYTKVNRYGNRLGCPVHGINSRKVEYIYICPDCLAEFRTASPVVKRCAECAYKRKRELQKKQECTQGRRKDVILLAPVRKPDCRHYLSYCLSHNTEDENWSCRFCRKYEPSDLDICAHVAANDPMQAAYSWQPVW